MHESGNCANIRGQAELLFEEMQSLCTGGISDCWEKNFLKYLKNEGRSNKWVKGSHIIEIFEGFEVRDAKLNPRLLIFKTLRDFFIC